MKPLVMTAAELSQSLGGQPKRSDFSQEHVRRHALVVLASIKDLTQAQRGRVLRKADQLNQV